MYKKKILKAMVKGNIFQAKAVGKLAQAIKKAQCGVLGCKQLLFQEGVCFWHYPLWEEWGYNRGGYEYYGKHELKVSRAMFTRWLNKLGHQEIVNILSGYDFKLAKHVIKSMNELGKEATHKESKSSHKEDGEKA